MVNQVQHDRIKNLNCHFSICFEIFFKLLEKESFLGCKQKAFKVVNGKRSRL